MNYVGVDLHQKTSWFYVVDSQGKKLHSTNVTNTHSELKSYLHRIPKPFTLAVESTYNWYFFVDMTEQFAEKVYLANSYELKSFAKRHKKTDKIDARLIATVLQRGYLPVVTIADKKTRELREFLRYRMNLVRDRTRCISRLKSLLDKLGCNSFGDYTTYKALRSIEVGDVRGIYKDLIRRYREQIMELSKKIYETGKRLEAVCEEDVDISNLLTIPGIGYFSAALIKSEIIDISHFRSFNRLCAYCGLAPRVNISGNRISYGPLNVNRRKNLQWILLENAYHFIKGSWKREEKFERIKQRKGHNTAKVAMARDMLKIIYHVLKEKRSYYHSNKVEIQSVATAALPGV